MLPRHDQRFAHKKHSSHWMDLSRGLIAICLIALACVCKFTSFGRHHLAEPVFNWLYAGKAAKMNNLQHSSSTCFSSGSFTWDRDIDKLFSQYGSDRGSNSPIAKRFHKIYGSLFTARRRTTAELVIEVGIGGSGLRTWQHFFQKAQILGVHNHPNEDIKGEERILTVPCNAASPLHKPKEYWEPFIGNKMADILIDSSREDPSSQAQILLNTYESLRSGGLYITEEFQKKPQCIGGCHHFCNLLFGQPFDLKSSRKSSTQELLQIFETNDVFYASMEHGQTTHNNMILMKKWPNRVKPFRNMIHNYHVVYNAFLSSVPIRHLMSYRSVQHQLVSNAACGGADGIDVFIASAQSGQAILPNILREFARSEPGSYLFIEEASFSFCQGAPDPSSGYWGEGVQEATIANPDWFYVMTEDDFVLSGKMLVMRKA